MAPATLALFLSAILASAFMAWVIGAGSSGATPFAPAVGANAISTMRAALVVGVFGFAGAVTQGASVTDTVGRGLVHGVALPVGGVVAVLAIGAGLMAIGIYTGYPIATAFTVTGATIGVGLALGGDPAWATYVEITAMWLLAPVAGGAIAYGIASVLPRPDVPETASVPLLGALVGAVAANLQLSFLGQGPNGDSLAGAAAGWLQMPDVAASIAVTVLVAAAVAVAIRWDVARDEAGGLRRVLLALGGLVAFSAGASQVGLAVGPLLPLLDGVAWVPTVAVLVGGGLGLLAGSWTGAPRMIKSLAQDYADLGPRRSIAALVPAFLLAQLAVLLGVPVSFNEIIVSAIVGSGLAVGGGGGVGVRKLALTAGGWAASFVLAVVAGAGVVLAFSAA